MSGYEAACETARRTIYCLEIAEEDFPVVMERPSIETLEFS